MFAVEGWQLLFRAIQTILIIFGYGFLLCLKLCRNRLTRTELPSSLVGRLLPNMCESLGGAFLKTGQILSTRQDLFPAEIIRPLQRLQDRVRPFDSAEVPKIIKRSLGKSLEELYSDFIFKPVASASIAQVHQARLRGNGKEVAVKVRRPGIVARYRQDLRLMNWMLPLLCKLPLLQGIPVNEAMDQVAHSLFQQTDFLQEAENNKRFQGLFANQPDVKIPHLFEEFCTDEILTMEFMAPLTKVDDPALEHGQRQDAINLGLNSLYRMIFVAGFIHCDLHPGNFFCGVGRALIILDTGFVAELKAKEKNLFREFFLGIALNQGKTCARILIDTALRQPAVFDRENFEAEIVTLIDHNSRLRAEQFQVSDFVCSLFTIQRKHGLYGSPAFTMAILSLLVYEGITKKCYPELDFQKAAIPFLLPQAS